LLHKILIRQRLSNTKCNNSFKSFIGFRGKGRLYRPALAGKDCPTKEIAASLGYAYERFKYTDAQLDNYQFVPAVAGTNGAYLTEAFKD
jgi:hypothetical protein